MPVRIFHHNESVAKNRNRDGQKNQPSKTSFHAQLDGNENGMLTIFWRRPNWKAESGLLVLTLAPILALSQGRNHLGAGMVYRWLIRPIPARLSLSGLLKQVTVLSQKLAQWPLHPRKWNCRVGGAMVAGICRPRTVGHHHFPGVSMSIQPLPCRLPQWLNNSSDADHHVRRHRTSHRSARHRVHLQNCRHANHHWTCYHASHRHNRRASHHHNNLRPSRRKTTPADTRHKSDNNRADNAVGSNTSYPGRFEHTSPSVPPRPSKPVRCSQAKRRAAVRGWSAWLWPLPLWAGSTSS